MTLARPETTEVLGVVRIAFYTALGRKAQADEIQRGFLARIDEHASATLLSEAVELLLASDLDAGQRAQMRTLARALAIQTNRTHNVNLRQGEMSFPAALLASTETGASRLPPADFAESLADLMVLWYPADPPPAPGTPVPTTTSAGQPRQWVANGMLNLDGDSLPPLRYLPEDMNSAIEQVENQLQQKANAGDASALSTALTRRAGAAGAGSARGAEILSVAGVGLHGLLPGRDRRGAGDRPGAARHASRRPGPASAHGDHPQPQQPDGGRHRAPESGGRGA